MLGIPRGIGRSEGSRCSNAVVRSTGVAANVARVEMADFIHGGGAKFTFRDVQNILRPHHPADAHLSPVLVNEQRRSF